jgi:hypothetical protein
MTNAAFRLFTVGLSFLCLCGRSVPAASLAMETRRVPAARQVDDALDAPSSETTVADDLDGCSPFSSLNGKQTLEFDVATGLVTREDESAGAVSPVDDGPPTTRAIGRFAVDERTRQVLVRLAGVTLQYTLVAPPDSNQCILAADEADTVDLERSWFGEVEDEPDLPSVDEDSPAPAPVT